MTSINAENIGSGHLEERIPKYKPYRFGQLPQRFENALIKLARLDHPWDTKRTSAASLLIAKSFFVAKRCGEEKLSSEITFGLGSLQERLNRRGEARKGILPSEPLPLARLVLSVQASFAHRDPFRREKLCTRQTPSQICSRFSTIMRTLNVSVFPVLFGQLVVALTHTGRCGSPCFISPLPATSFGTIASTVTRGGKFAANFGAGFRSPLERYVAPRLTSLRMGPNKVECRKNAVSRARGLVS